MGRGVLFDYPLTCWEDWRKVYGSPDAFLPLARRIAGEEEIGLGRCALGTNGVFVLEGKGAPRRILKLYAPQETGMDSSRDFCTECWGLRTAGERGALTPKLLGQGCVEDRYTFRYLLLEWVEGPSWAQSAPGWDGVRRGEMAARLRQVTQRLNRPCGPLPQGVGHPCRDGDAWKTFPRSFLRERGEFLRRMGQREEVFVHGDLNGDNLLLDREGSLVLLDFADACVGPVCLEEAIVACELFGLDREFTEGYFGGMPRWQLVQRCMEGLLLHPFGGNVIGDRLGPAEEFTHLDRLEERIGEMVSRPAQGR